MILTYLKVKYECAKSCAKEKHNGQKERIFAFFLLFYGRKNQKWIDNILNGRDAILSDVQTEKNRARGGKIGRAERKRTPMEKGGARKAF